MTAAQFSNELYKVNTLFNFIPESEQQKWYDAFDIFCVLNFNRKLDFNFDDLFTFFDEIEQIKRMLPSLN